MSPSNSICYFSSSSLFPLHLKCCCLYGAFRKQTSCSVILGITSDLWPVKGTRCDALCHAFESQLTDLEQICFYRCELQEMSWLTFFVYKQPLSPLQFALLCLVELLSIFKLSIFKVTCLRYTAAQWIESTQRSAVETECLFSWFLTGEEKLVGRQRHVVWASCTRCFWNVFLIYLFAFALVAIALALCWWFK